MGWMSLSKVLLDQIWYSDSLGWGPGFRRLIFQDQLLYIVLNIFAPCIVGIKIETITSNFCLKLANNDINLVILDEFTFENLDRM